MFRLTFLVAFLFFANNFTWAQSTKTIYTCPMHPQIEKSAPGDCPICGMTLEKKVVGVKADQKKSETKDSQKTPTKKIIHTCPMHPQIQEKAPGKCPICGMNLVPKEGDAQKNSESQNTINKAPLKKTLKAKP